MELELQKMSSKVHVKWLVNIGIWNSFRYLKIRCSERGQRWNDIGQWPGVYLETIFRALYMMCFLSVHLPVEDLAASGDFDQLQVTWSSPDTNRNPCSLHYTTEYELINRDQCEPITTPQRSDGVNQTTTGLIIDGLEAHSTYTVYVWTWNEAGLSEDRSINSTTSNKGQRIMKTSQSNVHIFLQIMWIHFERLLVFQKILNIIYIKPGY